MPGGVAVLDFDGDGWLDVYALQGGPFPPRGCPPPFGDRLFRNRGDGRFEDVTAASGLAALPGGYGHGVAVGDYDNDGRPDLFVTRWRSYALYRNLGGGRFEDATARAGLGGDRDWPTSAAWADLDNDGDLDLYVCHYLKWDAENPTLCEYPERSKPGYMYCDPLAFPALPDHLFRNEGGRFIDVTAEAGIVDRDGRGLGVVADDLDDDGKVDLFVANDLSANLFFRNLGGFRFSEQAMEAGLAASGAGRIPGRDGHRPAATSTATAVSTWPSPTSSTRRPPSTMTTAAGCSATDRPTTGLAVATRQFLGFGVAALDANNDGRLDLVQANGHVSDFSPAFPYEMTAQLLLGDATGRFRDASRAGRAALAGPPPGPRVGRRRHGQRRPHGRPGGRAGSPAGPARQPAEPCRWALPDLALEGVASNRDGVGARVTVTAGGRDRVASRFGGGSYLSASDPRLHFGLGAERRVDRVEVRWPSGRRDTYEGLTAGTGYRLWEGDPKPVPLAGFAGDPDGRGRMESPERPPLATAGIPAHIEALTRASPSRPAVTCLGPFRLMPLRLPATQALPRYRAIRGPRTRPPERGRDRVNTDRPRRPRRRPCSPAPSTSSC